MRLVAAPGWPAAPAAAPTEVLKALPQYQVGQTVLQMPRVLRTGEALKMRALLDPMVPVWSPLGEGENIVLIYRITAELLDYGAST